jgi:hypothetical protein
MDNVYALAKLAEVHLNEMRAERARVALLDSLRGPRRGLVERLGAALIRAGQWLSGEAANGADRTGRPDADWRRPARAA